MHLLRRSIVLLFLLLPSAAIQQQKKTSEENPVSQQSASSPSSPVIVTVNQIPTPEKTEHPNSQSRDWVGNLINLALVGVAFWGAKIAAKSLRSINDQAISTEKAANAARDNAVAVINAERAWIMAEAVFPPGIGIVHHTSVDRERTSANIELRLTNCGSTPAWVFEQFVTLEVSPAVIASKTSYPSPNFPFIGQGKTMHANYQILPIVRGQSPVTWNAFVEGEGWADDDGGWFVYVYGIVRYRDAFNSLRETYFGYSVNNGQLERIPNEAYNKHT